MRRIVAALSIALACALHAGCGSSRATFTADDAGAEAGPAGSLGSLGDAAASAPPDCSAASTNLAGCPCPARGATQPCYSGAVGTRGVGACKDGTQTCTGTGEFSSWGNCVGDVTPTPQACTGTVDGNCNAKVGCDDPTCAKDPVCDTGCTAGQTRACYDGAAGTENRGACKDGLQTCVAGKWSATCTGQVVPVAEDCCGAIDSNCNGLIGCSDLFACITAACCQNACAPAGLDPGCVCPTGSGDSAKCPNGDHSVTKGVGFPPFQECCPCTASTCNDLGCCGETVCAGKAACAGTHCKPLAAACGGMVNADCDEFPEDCDEPCCKCTTCPP